MSKIYLFLLFLFLGTFPARAQHLHPRLIKGDTSQTQFLYTYNKDFLIGTYLKINKKDILFRLRTGDTITVQRETVRELSPLFGRNGSYLGPRRYRIPKVGLFRSREVLGPQHTRFTHGWLLANALPIARGELHYRNTQVFYNELEYGFSDQWSAAATAILIVPSGAGFGLYNFRLKYARQLHPLLHVGLAANLMRIDEPNFTFSGITNPDHTVFYPQILATFGTPGDHLTIGFGYSKGSQTERLPDTGFAWHLSGMHSVSSRWRVTGEYIVPLTGTSFQFGQLGLTTIGVATRWSFGMMLVNDRVWQTAPVVGFGWRISPKPYY